MTGLDRDGMRAHVGMLARAVILGLSFTVVGVMQERLPPLLLTALRFGIAVVALLPIIWRAPDRIPRLSELALYSVLGLCQAAFFGAMFWAAHRMSALTMTVLYGSVPFLTYCLGLGLRVERPSGQLLGILTLGACGALGLAWADSADRLSQIGAGLQVGMPELVFFIGCIGLSFYSVLSKWGLARKRLSGQAGVRTFWSLLTGAVVVGALGLVEERPVVLLDMTVADLLLLLYLGVFSTGATFWLMQRATPFLTPAELTAYSYVPPFVSMLLLFVTRPDSMSWRWLPGAVLEILAMTALLRRDGERSARPLLGADRPKTPTAIG